jgi:hypothetical protein
VPNSGMPERSPKDRFYRAENAPDPQCEGKDKTMIAVNPLPAAEAARTALRRAPPG